MQAALMKAPPLFRLLGSKNRSDLIRLLATKPNLNTCALGMSPLMLATLSGGTETVQLLLDAGANANSPRDPNGGTALHTAIAFARWDVASLLLDRGADARLLTEGGTSVLHEMAIGAPPTDDAGRMQQLGIAREILQRGVAVDGRSGVHQTTPLMLAAVSGNRELLTLLLQHGADPRLTNAKGESALSYARRKGRDDIARLLEEALSRPSR
jgi:ankyrin repeat protein